MASRLELQDKLEKLFETKHVYFQPPESAQIRYPCIIYSRRTGETRFADNNPYSFFKAYDVTLIRQDPENDWVDKMAMSFPMCRYDRNFKTENLEHDVFVLYF